MKIHFGFVLFFLTLSLTAVPADFDFEQDEDPAVTAVQSCWKRRVWANGQAFNPNKYAAQSSAKSDYRRSVAAYKRKCEEIEGCTLRAPATGYPNCMQIGSNWQCRVSQEISCLKLADE